MIMIKNVKVSLDANEISQMITKLQQLKKDVKSLPNELTKQVALDGLRYLDLQYAITPNDDNVGDITTEVIQTNDGHAIIASGHDVIYLEFGTGDIGQANPHPEKNKYELNAYNSGETIRDANEHSAKHGITSGKYWTYKREGMDKPKYTQGIPAGKQMFNTRNHIISESVKKVNEKLVGDMLSKL